MIMSSGQRKRTRDSEELAPSARDVVTPSKKRRRRKQSLVFKVRRQSTGKKREKVDSEGAQALVTHTKADVSADLQLLPTPALHHSTTKSPTPPRSNNQNSPIEISRPCSASNVASSQESSGLLRKSAYSSSTFGMASPVIKNQTPKPSLKSALKEVNSNTSSSKRCGSVSRVTFDRYSVVAEFSPNSSFDSSNHSEDDLSTDSLLQDITPCICEDLLNV